MQRPQRTVHQFFRYAVVGGPAFLADFGTLWLLGTHGVGVVTATAIASLLGMAVNYLLCTAWVFPERSVQARWLEASIFVGVGLSGTGINVALMALLVHGLGVYFLISKIVCAIAVLGWTFSVRKLALFRGRTSLPEAVLEPVLEPVLDVVELE